MYSNFGMSDFKNENLLAKEEMERRGFGDPQRYVLCWSRNGRGIYIYIYVYIFFGTLVSVGADGERGGALCDGVCCVSL